tara:strand:- start:6610 stop:7395 length:786 start_codon:yes stop_codon:yes gene_type:complete
LIKEKKISILISTYNKCKFIKKTIKSCLNQKYSNYEIIIVDTQSTDGTDRIISSFSHFKKIKFLKIKRKFKNSPLNQLEAIKYGLLRTKGEIVCLLDGDDLFKKTKLQEVNKFFQSQNSTNFLQDRIELKKKIIKEKRTFLFFNILPNFFPTSTFSIKKKSLVFFIKKYSSRKLNLLEIDARLYFYSKFFKKDHFLLNKSLTIYITDQKGISSNFKRFSFEWFSKRRQAHIFMKKFFKDRNYSYRVDFFFSNVFYWFLKKI